jgi:cytochrome c
MKKTILLFALAGMFAACGGDKKEEAATEKKEETKAPDDPVYTEGMTLVAQSDCTTCHKIDEAFTGPAYKDVAAKYENTPENIALLSSRIIKGSKGVWGEAQMTAHAALSQGDAEKMVKYILMLKK